MVLYANIIQVNRGLFLSLNKVNILTVLIAWLNLDLGIETCFYDGMTAYAQTWLQFVFPMYMWVLISLIILTARHSVLLSRLLGSNPIAVLATLLLMSYTKILRIIIDVYSSVDLNYPEQEIVRVWLKDGNIPYLGSQHLLLTVVTSLVLVLLLHFPSPARLQTVSLHRPLLDWFPAACSLCSLHRLLLQLPRGHQEEHACYHPHIHSTGHPIGSGRIYRNMVVNIVEMFVYFNLVVFSTATLAEYKWPALVYSLVGMVLATMACAIVCQFHLLYIARTALWLRMKAKLSLYFQHSGSPPQAEAPDLPNPSRDPHRIVSKTVIELREPLLEI